MLLHEYIEKRENKTVSFSFDFVIAGGGMTGVCAAITAARQGLKVALIQDRPVLGGNASSEVRLWVLGATSHMGNNNRWSREGGVIDEILVENLYRNKEGNPVLFDTVLLDKVLAESNISLFLNTIIYEVEKKDARNIEHIKAFNPQNATAYIFHGKQFLDCSGDGIIAYNAGAAFRMGAEEKEEYGELFAPDKEKYGELLGHSILFYTQTTGKEVKYIPPKFALKNAEKQIPNLSNSSYFNTSQHGCKYWWLEYGGRLDTVSDTEEIKFELWKIVYGVWDYIKNSGKFPETERQTLEWVGLFPGKRESRRFEAYYKLTQQDIIEQREHDDAVAYGGWSIDLHPADAVYSYGKACNQWHSKGIYQIPYRCYVSKDIDNLFLGGRIISATHVAHGSSRVMCTSAHGGQAVAMAAALCLKKSVSPIDVSRPELMSELQTELIHSGQFIPGVHLADPRNLIHSATITASSTFYWDSLPSEDCYMKLTDSAAQLVPVKGTFPECAVQVVSEEDTSLKIELRTSSKPGNFTPDTVVGQKEITLQKGSNTVRFSADAFFEDEQYVFICFLKNENVALQMSSIPLSGTLTVYNATNPAVSNYGKQTPPDHIGVEAFEFWCPKRWPEHQNIALHFSPSLSSFCTNNLYNSTYRPYTGSNTWMAGLNDEMPVLTLSWDTPQTIRFIRLFFDTDSNQALENAQMGHSYHVVPQCVKAFRIEDAKGNCLFETESNYQTIATIHLDGMIETSSLTFLFKQNDRNVPVSLMGIICK